MAISLLLLLVHTVAAFLAQIAAMTPEQIQQLPQEQQQLVMQLRGQLAQGGR